MQRFLHCSPRAIDPTDACNHSAFHDVRILHRNVRSNFEWQDILLKILIISTAFRQQWPIPCCIFSWPMADCFAVSVSTGIAFRDTFTQPESICFFINAWVLPKATLAVSQGFSVFCTAACQSSVIGAFFSGGQVCRTVPSYMDARYMWNSVVQGGSFN